MIDGKLSRVAYNLLELEWPLLACRSGRRVDAIDRTDCTLIQSHPLVVAAPFAPTAPVLTGSKGWVSVCCGKPFKHLILVNQ